MLLSDWMTNSKVLDSREWISIWYKWMNQWSTGTFYRVDELPFEICFLVNKLSIENCKTVINE